MTSLILTLLMAQQQGTALTASVAVRPELIVDPSLSDADRITLQQAYATVDMPTVDPDGNPAPPCDKFVLGTDSGTCLTSKPGLANVYEVDSTTCLFGAADELATPSYPPCPQDGYEGQPIDGLVEYPPTEYASADHNALVGFPQTAPPPHAGTGPLRRSGILAESSYSPSVVDCIGQFANAEDSHYSPYANHNDICYLYVVPWTMMPKVSANGSLKEQWFNAADIGFQVSHSSKKAACYFLFSGKVWKTGYIIREGAQFSIVVNRPSRVVGRRGPRGEPIEYKVQFSATFRWKETYGENRNWQSQTYAVLGDDIIYRKYVQFPTSWVRCTSIAQKVEGASSGFHKFVKWQDSFGYDGTTKRSWNQIFNASQALKFSQDYPSNPARPQTLWRRPTVVTWYNSSSTDRFAEVVSVDTRPVP